jgi:hypothetical protein
MCSPSAISASDHHDAAKYDHRPGPAFGLFMVFAKKDVIVRRKPK